MPAYFRIVIVASLILFSAAASPDSCSQSNKNLAEAIKHGVNWPVINSPEAKSCNETYHQGPKENLGYFAAQDEQKQAEKQFHNCISTVANTLWNRKDGGAIESNCSFDYASQKFKDTRTFSQKFKSMITNTGSAGGDVSF